MAKQLSYLDIQKERRTVTIRDLPASERPRNRLARLGPGALSTAELLAIVMQTGVDGENALDVAARLLAHYEGLAGLARASFSQLVAERGVGPAKAAQIMAAIELGRRLMLAVPRERPIVYTPADAAALLMAEIGHLEQEHLCVLFLDSRNQVLGMEVVYKGTATNTQFRVGELFREAIRRNCAYIVVGHNHPSGDPTPSPEDIAATRAIVSAGQLLGVSVLDHIIVCQGRWVSMRDRRLGFDD